MLLIMLRLHCISQEVRPSVWITEKYVLIVSQSHFSISGYVFLKSPGVILLILPNPHMFSGRTYLHHVNETCLADFVASSLSSPARTLFLRLAKEYSINRISFFTLRSAREHFCQVARGT